MEDKEQLGKIVLRCPDCAWMADKDTTPEVQRMDLSWHQRDNH